jgi:hypothetical protein
VSISKMFGDQEDFLAHFPGRKRRWNLTIFRIESVNGEIRHLIAEQFDNVRSEGLSGDIVNHEGVLQFIDEFGKEVIVSSMPFIAKEVASTEGA